MKSLLHPLMFVVLTAMSVYGFCATPHTVVTPTTQSLNIQTGIEYWEQPADAVMPFGSASVSELDNLPWKSLKRAPLNLGNYQGAVWVRFPISTQHIASPHWVLRVNWPTLSEAEHRVFYKTARGEPTNRLFQADSIQDHSAQTHSEPRQTRPAQLDPTPHALSLTLPTNGQAYIYLRLVSGEKLIAPLTLYRADAHHQWVLKRNLLLGLFFGVLISMLGYNFSLYIFLRDNSYGVYCLYVATIIFYSLTMSGIGQAYLWHNNSTINAHTYGLSSSLGFLAAACFIRTFLELPKRGGWTLWLANLSIAAWVITITLMLSGLGKLPQHLADFMGIASCLIGITVTVYLWVQGSISAKYLTIAWAMLIVSTFILMMGITGIIPYGNWVTVLQYSGFAIEVVLLSMALAERINREKKQRIAAQTKVLEVERQAKIDLTQTIEEKTQALKQALGSLEKANAELSTLSQTDALTQLANRRHFDNTFEQEYKRAKRQHHPLSLIMVDIDHFKHINDQYGHQAGDECLKMVGQILKTHAARAEDFPARYGGEEFCILLPGLTQAEAQDVAESMRINVEDSTCLYQGKAINLTISLGIYGEVPGETGSIQAILKHADQALYQAKTNGRNRTEIY